MALSVARVIPLDQGIRGGRQGAAKPFGSEPLVEGPAREAVEDRLRDGGRTRDSTAHVVDERGGVSTQPGDGTASERRFDPVAKDRTVGSERAVCAALAFEGREI